MSSDQGDTIVHQPQRRKETTMAHPSFVTLNTIKCLTTEDLTGSDNLVAILGSLRHPIGQFKEGDSRDVSLTLPIQNGVTEMSIVEVDTIDSDDELITIDLGLDMDSDRVVGIMAGRARYQVALKVTSEPD
jgi:hypothetical protein